MYYRKKSKSKKTSNSTTQNLSRTVNNFLNYKQIFAHNRKTDKSIIFLKKTEFDIFYSCKYKYPILVKETITSQTGNPELNGERIDRSKLIDPFMEDTEIPSESRHTLEDYDKYMAYGVSMGHNAPAGQHKTNMKIFTETFLLSNITPQEMVFNSGLWALFENWCKKLGDNKKLYDITIFTGSIPAKQNTIFNNVGVTMNIPQKMFKIICFHHIDKPNITFMEILIANNSPYFINPKTINYDISPYLVSSKSLEWFQNYSNIDINNLLNFYGFNTKNIKPFRTLILMEIHLHTLLKLLMLKSNWYGYLIYAKTIQELDKKWEECKSLKFDNLQYHQEFYERVRIKLIMESTTNIKPNNIFSIQPVIKYKKYITTKQSKFIYKNKQPKKYSKVF